MRPLNTPYTVLSIFKATCFKSNRILFTPTKTAIGLTLATSIGIGTPCVCKTIYNDVIVDVNSSASLQKGQEIGLPSKISERTQNRSRFNGKLDYRQLCYGSILGLFLGIIVGKMSSFLAFLTASAYLGLQFLQNRDIIDKNSVRWLLRGFTLRTSTESIDFSTLIWERPSFKISFLLTFVLAAANI